MLGITSRVLTEEEQLTRPEFPERAHHTANGFINPWPSYSNDAPQIGFKDFIATSWLKVGKTVPIPPKPEDRPVQVIKPDFQTKAETQDCLKATWLGHASWLIEFPSYTPNERGITFLLDPVFSERTSPVSFLGPKRFTPTPCDIKDLPFVDAIAISHNHYDHLDIHSIRQIWAKQKSSSSSRRTRFFLPLKNKAWLSYNFPDIPNDDVYDLDWWEGTVLARGEEQIKLFCTPSQHSSNRSGRDKDQSLWGSWLFNYSSPSNSSLRLFFAGDTGYRNCPIDRAVPRNSESTFPGTEVIKNLPSNPTFKHIGDICKGVHVALLPIGCFNPVEWLSNVHAAPWDAVDMHKDLGACTSVAMHFGTVRGGVSAAYEPVDLPVKELIAACTREEVQHERALSGVRQAGKGEFVICDVGQTILIGQEDLPE